MCGNIELADIDVSLTHLPATLVPRPSVGPLSIGGKAWWKFSKIWLLCTDKNSKISQKVFGLQQAWVPKVKICSDCPSGPEKNQICSDWAIRPRKRPISFGLAVRPQKNGSYSPQMTIRQLSEHTELCLSHSASIPSALLASPDFTRPFLRVPKIAFITTFRTSWSFACNWLNTWISHCVEQALSVRDNKWAWKEKDENLPVALITLGRIDGCCEHYGDYCIFSSIQDSKNWRGIHIVKKPPIWYKKFRPTLVRTLDLPNSKRSARVPQPLHHSGPCSDGHQGSPYPLDSVRTSCQACCDFWPKVFGLHQAEAQNFLKICSDHHQGPPPILRGPPSVLTEHQHNLQIT